MLFPLLLLLFTGGSHGQFAEIASLATSFLGPGLSGLAGAAGPAAAAGGAAGALGQIGQLYQLAQGALQLTSTGVGVLNQATEGNWFPAALETAAKNQETFRRNGGGGIGLPMPGLGGGGGGLPGLMTLPGLGPLGPAPGRTGSSGIGTEFGTSFPAPDVDDYNEDLDILTTTAATTKKPADPFEEIEDKDLERPNLTTTPRAPPTTTEPVTLFPDEEEFETLAPTPQPKKQIRIELPKENKEEEDYFDQVRKEEEAVVEITNKVKKDGDEFLLPIPPKSLPSVDSKAVQEKKDKNVPNLEKLVDTLRQKSSLTEEEIQELVGQVETNGNVEVPPKIDFNSGVQNINEKMADNRKRILEASRKIDANWRGQPVHGHRPSNLVTISPTPAPTPAAFVHSTASVSEELQNNRLEREIVLGHADKDLLPQGKVERPLQKVLPRTIPTVPATLPSVAPIQRPVTAAPIVQPQTARPVAQPQLAPVQPQYVPQTAQQQYYYPQQTQQVPASFPISQQQAQYQQYYQQYQRQVAPQTQQQWAQPQTLTQAQYQQYYYSLYPQYYHTQQVLQGTTPQGQPQQVQTQSQPQIQQVQPQHRQPVAQAVQTFQRPPQHIQSPQQSQLASRNSQIIQPKVATVQHLSQQQVIHRPPLPPAPIGGRSQVPVRTTIPAQLPKTTSVPPTASTASQLFVPPSYKLIEGNMKPAISHSKNVRHVNGASSSVFVNQNGRHEKFFSTDKDTVVRGRRNQAKAARIHRQSNSTATRAPHRKTYPRTARTQPLTTPSPVGTSAANNLTKN